MDLPQPELVAAPCRSACDWAPDRDALWSCAGCGTQWRPGEPWTPRQADGSWPPGLQALLGQRGDRGRG